MSTELFIKGLLIGLSIAAPVGPIGFLCIKRTLEKGRLYGLISGLGVALADGLYGLIAALGLAAITSALIGIKFWLGLIGGLFLIYLGYSTFISKPAQKAAKAQDKGLLKGFVSIFLLTLTNPMTIMSFLGIFAGLGAGTESLGYAENLIIVIGVFTGSISWWVILTTVVSMIRSKLKPEYMIWLSRIAGLIIIGFGILSLSRIF